MREAGDRQYTGYVSVGAFTRHRIWTRVVLLSVLGLLTSANRVAAQSCGGGDCNSDGEVTVDEVIVGVNIALGAASLDDCASFDVNGDGDVTVEELVQAVGHALAACPTPTCTAQATACSFGEVFYDVPDDSPCIVRCGTPTPFPSNTPFLESRTPSPTATPTPNFTPSCAPTGTPYCSNQCIPCPTVRPNCYTVACGACIENPNCGVGEVQQCPADPFGPPPSGCCSCATPTPPAAQPSVTPTRTASPTPSSCAGASPIVEPVVSPTDQLQTTVSACGRNAGSSRVTVLSPAGFGVCQGICSGSSCQEYAVPLLPNQINHLSVCQENGSCPVTRCTSTDRNGAPLDVEQVSPSPTSQDQ
jgi:hypothetical protein